MTAAVAIVSRLAGRDPVERPIGSSETARAEGAVATDLARLPLAFEENRGQAEADVDFLARGDGYRLLLSSTEATLALRSADPLRMRLVGARAKAPAAGTSPLEGRVNYFIGNDPARWRTNVPTYGGVRYDDVHPGVDLVYYGRQSTAKAGECRQNGIEVTP